MVAAPRNRAEFNLGENNMLKTDKVCKKCRRAGQKLFLKGEKCLSPKCSLTRRNYPPGQHGQVPKRPTEYAKQLREKQKAALTYGISNRQFRKYYQKALAKKGMTDLALMRFLELRLDNVIFRLGFVVSRRQARTTIRDRHILVNGKKVTSPSFQIKAKDEIKVKTQSQKKLPFSDIKESLRKVKTPSWLKLDPAKFTGQFLKEPERSEIDTSIDERLILEYFAR